MVSCECLKDVLRVPLDLCPALVGLDFYTLKRCFWWFSLKTKDMRFGFAKVCTCCTFTGLNTKWNCLFRHEIFGLKPCYMARRKTNVCDFCWTIWTGSDFKWASPRELEEWCEYRDSVRGSNSGSRWVAKCFYVQYLFGTGEDWKLVYLHAKHILKPSFRLNNLNFLWHIWR